MCVSWRFFYFDAKNAIAHSAHQKLASQYSWKLRRFSSGLSVMQVHEKFLGQGFPHAIDGVCPKCTAGQRQRFVALTMERRNWLAGASVLHIAPERRMAKWIREHGAREYLSGDLYNEAGIKLNIEKMDLDDGRFDVVFCMHVLEHVDDEKSLSEMHRVLKPNGIALIMVPIIEGWDATYENPEARSDADRLLHFGQEDHIRVYGRDVRERLARHFEVEEITTSEPDVSRYALIRSEKIFLCRPLSHGG